MNACSRLASWRYHLPAALLTALLLSACMHGPFPALPHDWQTSTLDDSQAVARLQIIITYSTGACTHTALRLESPAGPPLLWDPGGGWGVNDQSPAFVQRHADVIRRDAPDLATYVGYRWRLGDRGVEVFEWFLDEHEGSRLYQLLTADQNSADAFPTDRAAWTCSLAVGDLLMRHGPPMARLSGKHFLPHRTATDLYRLEPRRVLLFRPGEAVVSMQPPGGGAR